MVTTKKGSEHKYEQIKLEQKQKKEKEQSARHDRMERAKEYLADWEFWSGGEEIEDLAKRLRELMHALIDDDVEGDPKIFAADEYSAASRRGAAIAVSEIGGERLHISTVFRDGEAEGEPTEVEISLGPFVSLVPIGDIRRLVAFKSPEGDCDDWFSSAPVSIEAG